MSATHLVRTPLFPLYSDLKACMRSWEDESVQLVIDLHSKLMELSGTPQAPVLSGIPSRSPIKSCFGRSR